MCDVRKGHLHRQLAGSTARGAAAAVGSCCHGIVMRRLGSCGSCAETKAGSDAVCCSSGFSRLQGHQRKQPVSSALSVKGPERTQQQKDKMLHYQNRCF